MDETAPFKITNYNVVIANAGFAILFGAVGGVFASVLLMGLLPPAVALGLGPGVCIGGALALAFRTPTSIVLGDRLVVHRVIGRLAFSRKALQEVVFDVQKEKAAGSYGTATIGSYLVAEFVVRAREKRREFVAKISSDEANRIEAHVGPERIRVSDSPMRERERCV